MDSLLDGLSIRRLFTEIIGYICLVVPVACSVWRYQRFPGVALTASVGAICGYILAALVIVSIVFNSVCRLYSSKRPTVLMYIIASAIPSLTLLLIGTTTKVQNEAVHGFDSLSVLLVQIISICLIITEWMAKVKEGDRDWSRDLSLCVADDFLYVYDVSVLFDFRLHDGEKHTAEVLLSLTIIACGISMFRYILRILRSSNNDSTIRNSDKSVEKEVLCHDLPFLCVRVVILTLAEHKPSHLLFPLKNLIFLVLRVFLPLVPCAQVREDAGDASDTSSFPQDISTPLEQKDPGLNKDESIGTKKVKLPLAA